VSSFEPPGHRKYRGFTLIEPDGSVKYIKDAINGLTWRALGTVQGGAVISGDAY
jgi:hypothetical protein